MFDVTDLALRHKLDLVLSRKWRTERKQAPGSLVISYNWNYFGMGIKATNSKLKVSILFSAADEFPTYIAAFWKLLTLVVQKVI